jgi:uroporphyrinogen-III synthase
MIASADERDLTMRLAGRRILVTRGGDGAREWAGHIQRFGAVPVVRAALDTETLSDDATREALRAGLSQCRWFVLTSARAVDALEEILGKPLMMKAPVAVVGGTTAERARDAGLLVRLVARTGTVAALAADLARELPQASPGSALPLVLHAGAEEARPGLEILETERRARLERVAVYRTRPTAPVADGAREELDVDVVLLASPSAVTGLLAQVRVPEHAYVVTIGPSTTAAAREAGLRVAGEAVTRDLLGMLRAIPREAAP